MTPLPILLSGLTIHTQDAALPNTQLLCAQGKIHQIAQTIDLSTDSDVQHIPFPASYHLIPGMIDMHIHGSHGADVMDATPAALDTMRMALAQTGVTSFLATTMTANVSAIEDALGNISRYQPHAIPQQGAKILGLHLEGPFISPEQPGAHLKELFLAPDIALFERWQVLSGGHIKLVTLAPELPDAMTFIRYLRQQQVIAAIGHSNAPFAIAQAAIEAGASHATHLFNAMSGFHHRHPGCVGALLLDTRVIAELIADDIHLDAATLALALKTKGTQGLVLVTDAMRAQCLGEGAFELGQQSVIVRNEQARLANGTLAGSVLTMNQALKNMRKLTDCSLQDVLQLTCANPAKALQVFASKGSIAIGKDADLVVLDEQLDVVMTICEGHICYARGM